MSSNRAHWTEESASLDRRAARGLGAIERALEPFPRAELAREPTPIHLLPRFSAHLGHEVHILREDLTGFTLGGNKIRKLEYLIGDALAKKAEVLLVRGKDSFTRNAAAAGKAFGLEVHVVVPGGERDHNSMSRALFAQFGAMLHYVRTNEPEAVTAEFDRLTTQLREQGQSVYPICAGGSDAIGSLGYLRVFDEIVRYSQSSGVHFDRIVVPAGSAGTQVGLLLGQAISEYDTHIIGMSVMRSADEQRRKVANLAVETASMLGVSFEESGLIIDDRFVGPGYAIPSEEGEAAVSVFALMEGILLDQVYGGKAAAGLIHYATNGELDDGDKVLFVHTGGNAGIYY